MNITEILITGYDGDDVVFATNVAPARARTVVLTDSAEGQRTVDCVGDVATTAFETLLEVMGDMGIVTKVGSKDEAPVGPENLETNPVTEGRRG